MLPQVIGDARPQKESVSGVGLLSQGGHMSASGETEAQPHHTGLHTEAQPKGKLSQQTPRDLGMLDTRSQDSSPSLSHRGKGGWSVC